METTALEVSEKPRIVPDNNRKNLTIEIVGAALFSALSIVLSVYLPPFRLAWGIADFDPVSIIWISAFLIFGFRAGILTSLIGTVGLILVDPFLAYFGPFMKFLSTIWFVLIPYLYIRFIRKSRFNGNDLKKLSNYIPSMLIAWAIRCILMSILNYLIITYMFNMQVDLGWLGLSELTGIWAILITVFVLNTLQSLFDVIVPYLLVFSTKIYDRYQIY